MLIRLLIAVLIPVGPISTGYCNCAAALPCVVSSDAKRISHSPTPESKVLGCRHNHKPHVHSAKSNHEIESSTSALSDHPHHAPISHHRECPTINPLLVIPSILSPQLDLPTDYDDTPFLEWVKSSISRCPHITLRPITRRSSGSVPLYISLLNLRN